MHHSSTTSRSFEASCSALFIDLKTFFALEDGVIAGQADSMRATRRTQLSVSVLRLRLRPRLSPSASLSWSARPLTLSFHSNSLSYEFARKDAAESNTDLGTRSLAESTGTARWSGRLDSARDAGVRGETDLGA
jgi:hypothetical protein